MIPFTEFPKIPRLRRDIIVTEKIDGTNASILVPEDDGPLLVGSRTRWITPEDDNAGFARWVRENEAILKAGLGYGHHFGEWWGSGIQRRYDLKEKRFSLFNVGRWREITPPLCHVVPVLYQGPWTNEAIDGCLAQLRLSGSFASPGFMKPEGVVVFHVASQNLYKVTVEKDEEPKGKAEWLAKQAALAGRSSP